MLISMNINGAAWWNMQKNFVYCKIKDIESIYDEFTAGVKEGENDDETVI